MAASAPEVATGVLPTGDHPQHPVDQDQQAAASFSDTATTSTSSSSITTNSSSSSSSSSSAALDPALVSTLDSFPRPATLSPSKPTPATAAPRRILTPATSHRRNQSQDHLTFSKFTSFPSVPATSMYPSSPDPRINLLNPMARSSSMPAQGLVGHGVQPITAPITPATSAERETYTLSDRTSTLVQTTGQVPPPLIGSTSIIHKNRLYLFGGRPVNGGPTNDLYVLNLDTLVWTLIDQVQLQQQQQQQQEEEEAEGGHVNQERRQQDRLHPLSPYVQHFSETTTSRNTLAMAACATATIPSPRYYHSAVLVTAPPLFNDKEVLSGWGDEDAAHMVIFGGRSVVHDTDTDTDTDTDSSRHGQLETRKGDDVVLNDTHILDLNTMHWIPSALNQRFSRRTEIESDMDHVSVSMQTRQQQQQQQHQRQTAAPHDCKSSITRPGGSLHSSSGNINASTNNTPEQTSEPPKQTPEQHDPFCYHTPYPRYGHVASLNGDHMVIIGGRGHNDEGVEEISVLDLGRRSWMLGGEFHGECSQCLSALAGMEERPMARRRRRYLERISVEQGPDGSSSSKSLRPSSSSTTPVSLSNSSELGPLSPTSTSMLLPQLNPRKNSWHRGEGHPFELPSLLPDNRQRFKSDTGLPSTMIQDDNVWLQETKLHENLDLVKTHGLVGLGMDPEISKAMAKSAGVPMTAQDAIARARKSSISAPKGQAIAQSTATSSISSASSGSDKSRKRTQSQTTLPLKSPPSTRSSQGRASSHSSSQPVTHAVPPKFFVKSSGSMFDLDDLATTIARERKPHSPRGREGSTSRGASSRGRDKDRTTKRSNSNSAASSGSSRRSSGVADEIKRTRSQRSVEVDRSESKSDKRRSLDSALGQASSESAADEKELASTKATRIPATLCPPLYMFSSHPALHDRQRHEFLKIQASEGYCKPYAERTFYDIKPEWTALDANSSVIGGSEGLLPPRMLFPIGHVVDHYFLLSGASIDDLMSSGVKPPPIVTGDTQSSHTDPTEPTIATALKRRHSYSVWMHHLHNHQWTQLELSKNLGYGEWDQSVLDRENNYLYILGQRDSGRGQDRTQAHTLMTEDLTNLESKHATASFAHMVKVDLEGFEICPAVDESSIGSRGVKLGLEMLRDGIGADVVLVSSADGGRVRVNSGIVGQRWGYFQTLMKERKRIWEMEASERMTKLKSVDEKVSTTEATGDKSDHSSAGSDGDRATSSLPVDDRMTDASTDMASKQWFLGDQPAEIIVRETTPILVGFLQYVYTNELTTPHQLKLKTLQGLLLLAHLYDLTRLQQLVRRALYQQLNASNASAICEIAVLTHEFGLQTRALRTLLQSARLAQLRQQGEAAEAKRRLEFAKSRLEEIEQDRKRKASMRANSVMLQQQQNIQQGLMSPGGTSTRAGGGSLAGNSTLLTGNSSSPALNRINSSSPALNRINSTASSTTTSATSTPGLSTIGRFFRHREESVESVGPML
ncbi:hypothetical protein BGX28_007523 [Mortierella sp. GBA30]|nr:hypothetical protein BGX28_007523 [Mortierella sp. GBA30]